MDPEDLVELPLESAPPALTVPPLVVAATAEPPLPVLALVAVPVLPPFDVTSPLDFDPDELLPPDAVEVLEVERPPAPSPGSLFSEQPIVHRSEPAIMAQCLVIMDSAFPRATQLVVQTRQARIPSSRGHV